MMLAEPTPEQVALFVECYVRTDDGLKAAQQAKLLNPMYSIETIVARLLERPDVCAAISILKKQKKDHVSVEVTRESLEAAAQNLYDTSMSMGDNKTALACLRFQAELKKLLGQDVTLTVKHDVSALTDAQLAAIVAGKPIDADFTDVTDITPRQGIAQVTQQ